VIPSHPASPARSRPLPLFPPTTATVSSSRRCAGSPATARSRMSGAFSGWIRPTNAMTCPVTGSPRDCNTQFTSKQGGNPDLKPEKSKNFTAGFVFEPSTAFSFGVDYYNIKIDDVVGIPAEEPIFNNIPESEAAGLIVRYAPGSAGCPTATPGVPSPGFFTSIIKDS